MSETLKSDHRGSYITLGELVEYWGYKTIDNLVRALGNGEYPQVFESHQIYIQPLDRLEGDVVDGHEPRIRQRIVTSQDDNAVIEQQEFSPYDYESFRDYEAYTRSLVEFKHIREDFFRRISLHYDFLKDYGKERKRKLPAYWKPRDSEAERIVRVKQILKSYVKSGGNLPPAGELRKLLRGKFQANISKHEMAEICGKVREVHPDVRNRRPVSGRPPAGQTESRLRQVAAYLQEHLEQRLHTKDFNPLI